jgi:hypothetical protein
MQQILIISNPSLWFIGIRLKAMRKTAHVINNNSFSGPYSQNEIEAAHKNRKLNIVWFVRNFQTLKKYYNEEFDGKNMSLVAEWLDLSSALIEIEYKTNRSSK